MGPKTTSPRHKDSVREQHEASLELSVGNNLTRSSLSGDHSERGGLSGCMGDTTAVSKEAHGLHAPAALSSTNP